LALAGLPGAGSAVAASAGERVDPYIVVMKDGSDPGASAGEHTKRLGARVSHVFGAGLNGYAARIPARKVADLRADPRVAYVEADVTVRTAAQTLPWGVDRIEADISSTRAGNGSGAVAGVNEYIMDSGISSSDLSVVAHGNWSGDGKNYDCNGHGTHVAGTVGARDNASHSVGVAPGVVLVGLKVMGCGGTGPMSNVIAAINWVTTYAIKPAVVNLSLTSEGSRAVDDAVRRSVAKGVLYVVAAGNEGANACSYSPARLGGGSNNGVITVAATDSSNREASFSNYGPCVDIWAPGVGIVSTSNNGGTTKMSGTSMATPHVSGAAGLLLARYPMASPAQIEGTMKLNLLSPGTASKDGRPVRIVSAARY
jgi:subtilisin family serine protease